MEEITIKKRKTMKGNSIKGEIGEGKVCRRKRYSRATTSKRECSTLLSQSTNGDKIDGRVRSMQTILEDKNHGTISRCNTETDSATCKSREKATVSSLHRNSLSSVVIPEQSAITNDMMSASRVQNRVVRENGSTESVRRQCRYVFQ
jgi:hypothetical protein